MKHIGKVWISEELILQWLQFQDGSIKGVEYDCNPPSVGFIIEHNEMPEVKEGETISIATPMYTSRTNGFGNSVAIRQPLQNDSRVA